MKFTVPPSLAELISASVYKQHSREGDGKDACLALCTFTVEAGSQASRERTVGGFTRVTWRAGHCSRAPAPRHWGPCLTHPRPCLRVPPGPLLWALVGRCRLMRHLAVSARASPGNPEQGLEGFLPHSLPSRSSLFFSAPPLITIIVITDLKNSCC